MERALGPILKGICAFKHRYMQWGPVCCHNNKLAKTQTQFHHKPKDHITRKRLADSQICNSANKLQEAKCFADESTTTQAGLNHPMTSNE